MSVSLFDAFLSTPEMIAAFDDGAVVQAMFRFEETLARAQAAHGLIPDSAARAIAGVCKAPLYDIPALVHASRRAGSLAIPLVKELTAAVALYDKEASTWVHYGSTSQDVIDSAMVLVTREALALLDAGLATLVDTLLALAERHAGTPVLARTLMQPAQVTSFGFKAALWAAPLVRSQAQLKSCAARALQLQLGGAVGTRAVMGAQGAAVARHMADELGLACPAVAWHTQRDEWVRLGLEVAVLTGSLGKIATDLALMAQGEIGELAEPVAVGRGGSSAMPHKRNPVAAMIALAASGRSPHAAANLLGAMGQQHERGLGNWQAELAGWPGLFLSAHGALAALNEAMAGLQVDEARMRANIDALGGLVFGEALAGCIGAVIGRPAAHTMVEELTRSAVAQQRHLAEVASDAVEQDERLRGRIDLARWQALFDLDAAAQPAAALAHEVLRTLRP
ncbi:lyase family protein [Massilia yuzhufengensis]|uniref:3-carboxy-cis,cis-muconate cycloisomerase n=1 Tax=Massilia yuzhufengensis TaxID=1164594 RepID=A0A1I1N360_9BURK|nr:lyase family protein [Massilia yuzhufengensis]SFC91865.1 3-carboxy-cis,cis-muconate cycloisomerase [Massilia yuzhufengensis]